MDEWRRLHALLRREHLEDAPERQVRDAEAIFQRQAIPPRPAQSLRTLMATLIFDSFLQPAFAGARGVAEARQILLQAADLDIHVKVSTGSPLQVMGQILIREKGSFVKKANLHLLENGKRLASTTLDEFGEFHFDDVPTGLLNLQIDLPHLTILGTLDLAEMP